MFPITRSLPIFTDVVITLTTAIKLQVPLNSHLQKYNHSWENVIELIWSHHAKESTNNYNFFCSADELEIGLYITILTGLHGN